MPRPGSIAWYGGQRMHVVYARTHRRDPTEPRRQPIWWREPATGGGEGRGARNASFFFFPFPFPPSPALSSTVVNG